MNRKEFIRNISLVGVGVFLAPTRLLASSKEFTVQLPLATVHVPHGNFAQAPFQRVSIPELNLAVSVQHFMRNGIASTPNDISVFTFQKKDDILNVCFDDEGCHTFGSISGLVSDKTKTEFSLGNEQFEAKLNAGSSYLSVLRKT